MTFGFKRIVIGLVGAAAGFLATEATEKGLWALDGKLSKEENPDTADLDKTNDETKETKE
jgi:hypothetical protein